MGGIIPPSQFPRDASLTRAARLRRLSIFPLPALALLVLAAVAALLWLLPTDSAQADRSGRLGSHPRRHRAGRQFPPALRNLNWSRLATHCAGGHHAGRALRPCVVPVKDECVVSNAQPVTAKGNLS